MDDPRTRNEQRYDRMAKAYPVLMRLASVQRLYRALANELDVAPNSTLVELGCGPATVAPHLLARLTSGRYVGVDVSRGMVERANAEARARGWTNVEFVRCAALDYSPSDPVAAVVFSLSLSCMPEPPRCAEKALSLLAPGGQLLILDSPLTGSRWVDFAVRAKSRAVGAVPEDFPLQLLRDRLDGLQTTRLWGGVYTILSGRLPARDG